MAKTTAEIAAALTPAQVKALFAVKPSTFNTATELGVSGGALAALARIGLVDVKTSRIQSSNPRSRVESEPIVRRYRITGRGVVALGMIKRAARK